MEGLREPVVRREIRRWSFSSGWPDALDGRPTVRGLAGAGVNLVVASLVAGLLLCGLLVIWAMSYRGYSPPAAEMLPDLPAETVVLNEESSRGGGGLTDENYRFPSGRSWTLQNPGLTGQELTDSVLAAFRAEEWSVSVDTARLSGPNGDSYEAYVHVSDQVRPGADGAETLGASVEVWMERRVP